jgi:carbon-monoxide dehydrogenase large subunit
MAGRVRFGIGQSVRRVEDVRFLTGEGRYVDDFVPTGTASAVVLRSPHAHAEIGAIDVTEARNAPGILGVYTGRDIVAAGLGPVPPYAKVASRDGTPFFVPPRFPLAVDRVRHVGEGVALVVGRTEEEARDACDRIAVEYRPRPAVPTSDAARDDVAPAVWDDRPSNLCYDWEAGDRVAVDAAFDRAAHVTRLDLVNHRVSANPIEPRGAFGMYAEGRYTLYLSGQNVHLARLLLASSLGIPPEDIRMIAPDVGGGFGMKNFIYPEHVLVLWAAREIGRPVRWIASRTESFVSDDHGRDHVTRAELALDGDAGFIGLKVATRGNIGAYVTATAALLHTAAYAGLTGGVYAVPAVHLSVEATFGHVVPLGAYRGVGYAESQYVMERLVDAAARELCMDPAELRRRNYVRKEQMPFRNFFGSTIDSGDLERNQDDVLGRIDRAGFAERRARSEACGRLRGFGLAAYMEMTSGPPDEEVEIRFEADGTVTVATGTRSNGQGHETTFPQIVADRLGVPFERIRFVQGDTDRIAKGGGHGGSRATHMGGTALHLAAESIVEKARLIAALALEVSPADIEFADGAFTVAGTDRRIDLIDVAHVARDPRSVPDGMDPGLDTLLDYTREAPTFPTGCHACEVEVDMETGMVTLDRYAVVDDFGTLVNPMIAEGQVHGGIAQGAGQALLERIVVDGQGQVLTGSFMDYAMPRADDFPEFVVAFNEEPCTTNPLGVKGAGEAGAIGALPAVMNAVADALAPYGVKAVDGPLTSERVWRLLQGHGAT